MKKKLALRGFVLGLALLALVAGAVLPQRTVAAAEDVVRLTINNDGDGDIWLLLNGPAYYYLHVPVGTTRIYTPKRGVYDYTLYSCGTFVKGELDLTTQKTIDVPACGLKAHTGEPLNTVDAGKMLNLVDVTFKNKTGRYMLLILEGPSVYVFRFNSGESKEYTIPMGYYSYTLYGCGSTYTGNLYARFHKVKEFTCP